MKSFTHLSALVISIRIRTILRAGSDGRFDKAKHVLEITIDEMSNCQTGDIPYTYMDTLRNHLELALHCMYLDALDGALEQLVLALNTIDANHVSQHIMIRRLDGEDDNMCRNNLGAFTLLPISLRWHIARSIESGAEPNYIYS